MSSYNNMHSYFLKEVRPYRQGHGLNENEISNIIILFNILVSYHATYHIEEKVFVISSKCMVNVLHFEFISMYLNGILLARSLQPYCGISWFSI